ncbi:MAG TPA: serine hydrolase domain-containing protein [Actinomycetota bacterium]
MTSSPWAGLEEVARRTDFSGVIRVDRAGAVEFERAFGLADRAHGIVNAPDTRLAIASGSKGFTALAVMSLVEDGTLGLATTARSILGPDLPLIDDRVTVEQLLSHRSGIGDYLDEEAGHDITDHVMPVPVHRLATTEDYLVVLDGYPMAFEPEERFAYNNGGYVVLARLAERASTTPFHDLVRRRVLDPAGMHRTAFLRSDELPGDAALGYLTADGSRTNVLHLPVLGSGDGGAYSTVADLAAFWRALVEGRIVSRASLEAMVRPRSVEADGSARYGLGVWLHAASDAVWLEGYDAGVSFRSVHDPVASITHTVIANTSEGAWPLTRLLDELLGT